MGGLDRRDLFGMNVWWLILMLDSLFLLSLDSERSLSLFFRLEWLDILLRFFERSSLSRFFENTLEVLFLSRSVRGILISRS